MKLDDGALLSDCTVFYRPSFGRGGMNTANFGEFDAIVSTKTCVYLIESKWEGETRRSGRNIKLSKTQIARHTIFAEYFRMWDRLQGKRSLAASEIGEYLTDTPSKKMTPFSANLANHLQFVFSRIATTKDNGNKKPLKNVVLFLHREEDEKLNVSVDPEDFIPILMGCPPSLDSENGCWFFEMDDGRSE